MSIIQIQPDDLTPAEWIQIMYPHEPDWANVDSETLVALVEDFVGVGCCRSHRHRPKLFELSRTLSD